MMENVQANPDILSSVIVSYSCKDGHSVLLIGSKPEKNKDPKVINAFTGIEADELWKKIHGG